jgi:peptidoglycan/LPS O-acetylase OafA/YrhL
MKYRAEIDGLRAIAVVPVILFHLGLGLFSGGFLGVDVFFVISGYLITSILYEQIKDGNFSVLRFYDRRIRRILPPLIITALLTIAITVSFTPSDIKNVGQSLVATFTFLSNYFFYLETDYFNPFNQLTPMLHTWSLSVEEQYYIFAPFLIYFMSKFHVFKYFTVIVLTLISFYFAVSLTNSNATLSFYSIHTRAWELLMGTLLALVRKDFSCYKPHWKLSECMSFIGLLALAWSFVFFDQTTKHPSFMTIIPVVGTMILIFYLSHTQYLVRFISNKILVFTGLLSYSLYLFHNPIFSAIKYHFIDQAFVLKIASLPIVFLLSFLSYKYVEKPSRNSLIAKANIFYSIVILAVIAIVSLSYLAHSKNGFLEFFRSQTSGNIKFFFNVEEEEKLTVIMRENNIPSDTNFTCKKETCTNILVVGDSQAEDTYFALQSIDKSNYSVRYVWYDDKCLSDYVVSNVKQLCNDKTVDLSLLNDADFVLIAAYWAESTYNDGYEFAKSIKQNIDADADVVLLGSAVFEDMSSFAFKITQSANDLDAMAKLAYTSQRFDRLRVSDKLKKLSERNANIYWIERADFFCEKKLKKCYLYDENSNPLIWDNAHLTTRAYPLYGSFLINKITQMHRQ